MAWQFPKLSRRSLMAATACSGAALALLRPSPLRSETEKNAENTETTYSICNFCSSLCNIRVTTQTTKGTKRIIKLDGNPNSTLNRGKICARGQSGLRQTYDTDRLKTPLIRVTGSKRGEYAFRSASWEEAWNYIAEKTQQENIKPWEWTMVGGWTSCVFYMYWAVPFAMGNGIPNIVASPMQHCVTTGHLGTDAVTGNFNVHDEILPDYDNAKYILFISNNASIGAVSTARMVRFATARKKGAYVVALDPRQSETAAKADEWIAIRPGTDLDFVLAMLHVILTEELYDREFVVRHTNLPFLVTRHHDGSLKILTDEQGQPQVLSEPDAVRTLPAVSNDNTTDVNGRPVKPRLTTPVGFTVDTQSAMTVLEAQIAEIKNNTPEWAAQATGVDPATIRRIARAFALNRPAIVDPGWHGARYGNVMMLRRVQAMLQALTGGIDVEGGWIMSGEFHHKALRYFESRKAGQQVHAPLSSLAGLPFANMVIDAVSNPEHWPHGKPGWSFAYSEQERNAGRFTVALPAMSDFGLKEAVEGKLTYNGQPYKCRALLINAANPVRHYYSDSHWKQILQNQDMKLVIVVDVLPSDTTPYADVILPSSTYLERNEPILYGNGVNHDLALVTRHAAISPLYDTRESPEILFKMTEILSGRVDHFLGAAEKLTGLPATQIQAAYQQKVKEGEKNPFTEACREVSLKMFAKKLHISPDVLDRELREKGVFFEEKKEDVLARAGMPRYLPMLTPSGRLEFYSNLFASFNNQKPEFSPIATYIPAVCRADKSMKDKLDTDEFYFIYGKTPTVSYGSTNSNNPVLAAINMLKSDIYTGIWVHPERADLLHIRTGDRIKISNILSGQEAMGRAYVTRLVQRDSLFLYSSFGTENPALTRSHNVGTAINKLIPYQVDPVVAGFRSQEFTVRVRKITDKGTEI